MKPLVRAKSVTPRQNFMVEVVFEDNTTRAIDLEKYLHGPVFESIRNNAEVFRSVQVEDGVLTWHTGEMTVDIDPDVLYYDLRPAAMEKELT
jgi:hypothetical protein